MGDRRDPPDTDRPGEVDEPTSGWTLAVLAERWHVSADELSPRYRLGDLLGRGGMGEVRLARDRRLRRDVAVKTVRLDDDAGDAVARFLQEAQVTGQLAHPNIPPIHDLGLGPTATAFFTMRALPGRSLARVLKEDGRFGVARALELFGKVCDAVAYAHSRGVLHRDLKPGNVVVGDYGEVYVIDWGLAKRIDPRAPVTTDPDDSGESLTTEGSVVGTPGYMSPEQAAGAAVDARGDVYALGALLYTLVTGRSPFAGPTPEVLLKVHRGEFPRPRRVRPDLPWELEQVVLRAMSLRPEHRYASVADLKADLAAFGEGRHLAGVRYGPLRSLAKTLGRHRRSLVGVGVALGAGTFVAVGFLVLYAVTVAVARDRAVAAERLAEGRALDRQVALARLRAESGAPGLARADLRDAVAVAGAIGRDDRPARFALAALDTAYPPPELRVRLARGHQAVLDPDTSRVGVRVGGRVFVHDLGTGALLATWDAPPEAEVRLDSFGGGALRTHVRRGQDLTRFDALTGRAQWSIRVPGEPDPDQLVFSADDTRVAWSAAGRAIVFALPSGERVAEIEGAVAGLSADGRRALVYQPAGGPHRQVDRHEVVDLASGAVLGAFRSGNDAVPAPDLSFVVAGGPGGAEVVTMDGRRLWSGGPAQSLVAIGDGGREAILFGADGVIEVRDAATGEVRFRRHVGEGRVVIGGAPLVGAGWIGSRVEPDLHLWSRSSRPPAVVAHDGLGLAIDVSPDGLLLATAGWDGTVALWDWRAGLLLERRAISPDGVRDVAFSPDGGRLATADRTGDVRIVDLLDGTVGPPLDADHEIAMGVRWIGPDRVVAAYEDGHLVVWDTAGEVLSTLRADLRTAWALAAGGGRGVVSGRDEADPEGEVWDLGTGARVGVTRGLGTAYGAAIAPDGTTWAVGNDDGVVRLVGADRERSIASTSGGPAMSLGFSPDGALLAVGSYAGQLSLYDASTGVELLSVRQHEGSILDLVFLPTSQVVLTLGGDPGGFAILDLERTAHLGATELVITPGASAGVGPRVIADRAELRWDWVHARAGFEAALQAGDPVSRLALARVRLASGDREGARAALAGGERSAGPGTLATWRRALE